MESMVSTSSQLVPEESVEHFELSTPEVRWQWYRAHPSVAPDLGRFPVALPGVAGSASVLVPVGKKPTASVSKSSQQIVDSSGQRLCKRNAR